MFDSLAEGGVFILGSLFGGYVGYASSRQILKDSEVGYSDREIIISFSTIAGAVVGQVLSMAYIGHRGSL